MIITAAQCRAARALLDWSQPDLAKKSGIHVQTISNFEHGNGSPTNKTLGTIRETFESEGVDFSDHDDGVRRTSAKIQYLHGADGFQRFMDDVYDVAKTQGGEICLHNANPKNWLKWLGSDWNTMHTNRMLELGKLNFKITAAHDDYTMIGKHAEYRWLPREMWNDQSFYAYGNRIALLNFEKESINIVVMHNQKFANGFRKLFNVTWDNIAIIPPQQKK